VTGRALMNIALLLISILLVFIGCDLFTNGIEWIGLKFRFSESVVGSILAAIGTALPETIIPIIAIFFIGGGKKKQAAQEATTLKHDYVVDFSSKCF
jgi:cation:H+ antiporter